MKKLILTLVVICVIVTSALAHLNYLNLRNCTATYTRKFFDSNGVNVRTRVIINTASNCKLAMQQAKEMMAASSSEVEPTGEIALEESENNEAVPVLVPMP